MKDEPVKSPFVKTVLITKELNGDKIVKDSLHHFALLLSVAKAENREVGPDTFRGFIAGFTSTLIIIGFNPKDATSLGDRLLSALLNVGKD